jgi:hypothetical protein
MWLAFMSIHRPMPLSYPSMRRARSRRSTERSPVCQ